MDARQELLEFYDFWHASSEREGEAIRAGDWPAVAQCQEVKRQLQPKIIRHTETAQQEWTRAGRDWADVQRDVRAVVGLLMDLETRNGELLAGRRRGAETKMAGLEGAHRTLQRVHRSYAPEQPEAWHSYS